jgi:hypothetical protein
MEREPTTECPLLQARYLSLDKRLGIRAGHAAIPSSELQNIPKPGARKTPSSEPSEETRLHNSQSTGPETSGPSLHTPLNRLL